MINLCSVENLKKMILEIVKNYFNNFYLKKILCIDRED